MSGKARPCQPPAVGKASNTAWITEIARALYNGGLPDDFYAKSERVAGQTGPDVLTLDTDPEWYVTVPLERTYCAAWEAIPARWRRTLSE